MPIAAQCPNCGGPLSETSVLALAPVCERCGTVITEIGGTLGLTSAYGVSDPTITRKRVEADLAVFGDYRTKYIGMREACKEQLNWGVERYAKLPPQPELLEVLPVPPLRQCAMTGLGRAALWGLGCCTIGWCLPWSFVVLLFLLLFSTDPVFVRDRAALLAVCLFYALGTVAWWGGFVLYAVQPHYKAERANGERPLENARRRRAYESAYAVALKAAGPIKAAQDHRLSCQIRELDGLIKTVTKKAEEIRRILKAL